MPMLGPDDPLLERPRRVLVAGTPGSGKTTLAATVGRVLDLPHTELDSLYHGPGWVPRQSFVADVQRFSAEPTWVSEWQYGTVRDLLADRADLLIWLDLPRRLVMTRVIRRTLRRRFRRVELWNGNQEGPLWTVFTEPDHIVRWAWANHRRTAARIEALRERRPELIIVRLPTRAAVEQFCRLTLVAVANRP